MTSPYLTQPLRSESEVRDQPGNYRAQSMLDVIAPDRTRYSGMSDDQLSNELAAQRFLARAIRRMHFAIAMVNHNSAVVKIDAEAFNDFVSDEFPSDRYWEERIAAARRP